MDAPFQHPTPENANADVPQPLRDGRGATDPGPRNVALDRQNPDALTPPPTDHGTVPNLKFSFATAHTRLEPGGWAREVTARELPIATTLAGVNMRLRAGGVRELHWHKQSEWSFMLNGRARITAVDQEGRNFVDDVGEGDLWSFPSGIPHSIQGLEEGCEFLLVFDDGNFSENSTFLLSDWLAHTPKEVLAKNFGGAQDDFAAIPSHELYIFQGRVPGPLASDRVSSPQGTVPQSFSYHLLAQEPIQTSGGTVRIADATDFPVATTTAAALVEVEPGAMRELHWHPNADEWQYYIAGRGRMTAFASGGRARTFDYQPGDVGYVPFAMGHYIENTGAEPLRFLELFKSDPFTDNVAEPVAGADPARAGAGPPASEPDGDGRVADSQGAGRRVVAAKPPPRDSAVPRADGEQEPRRGSRCRPQPGISFLPTSGTSARSVGRPPGILHASPPPYRG